jgi:hypothetical protein
MVPANLVLLLFAAFVVCWQRDEALSPVHAMYRQAA